MLKRFSFIGDGLSHVAFGAVGIGLCVIKKHKKCKIFCRSYPALSYCVG
ncbi:MAG: metal ABC transporter permease [Ruminococcus sp.]